MTQNNMHQTINEPDTIQRAELKLQLVMNWTAPEARAWLLAASQRRQQHLVDFAGTVLGSPACRRRLRTLRHVQRKPVEQEPSR